MGPIRVGHVLARGHGIAALGFTILSVSACGSAASAPPPPPPPAFPVHRTAPDAVHVEGRTLRDGLGRQLLFRGYNAKAITLFDVTFPDGATPNETFFDFDEKAAGKLEDLGLDVIRLPVSWSGFEPEPQHYATAFLDKLDAVLALAEKHHVYVFIDMHQDAYSKWIGEDGEPLWAITPKPTMILQGPSTDARRTTAQVLDAGFSFFDDAKAQDGRPLQDAFVAAVQRIVRHVVGNPVVLGYEAFNEPVVFSQAQLDAFHAKFADAVHAIDADAPVLFEPISTRNEFDSAYVSTAPWGHGPGVYAPHIYTAIFSVPDQNDWASEDPSVLAPSMAHAEVEAQAWGTPLFVGEFGCDQSLARGPKWLSAELDLEDEYLASSTVWEFSQRGAWGFFSSGYEERPATAKVVSRNYPRAVAGDLVAIERPAPGHMLVRWRATPATAGLAHEVSISDSYATAYEVRCDGASVPFLRDGSRATFVCGANAGERTFEVIGVPR